MPIASYLAVDALLDQVFAADPMHPAHHYRIHLWDYEQAENALGSAALCGQVVAGHRPHVAHAGAHLFEAEAVRRRLLAAGGVGPRRSRPHDARPRAARSDSQLRPQQRVADPRHDLRRPGARRDRPGQEHDRAAAASQVQHARPKRQRAISAAMRLFEVLDAVRAVGRADRPGRHALPGADRHRSRAAQAAAAPGHGLLSHGRRGRRRRCSSRRWQKLDRPKAAAGKGRSPRPSRRPATRRRTTRQITKARDQARRSRSSRSSINDWRRRSTSSTGHQAVAAGDFKRGLELLRKAGSVEQAIWPGSSSRPARRTRRSKPLDKHVNAQRTKCCRWPAGRAAVAGRQEGRRQESRSTSCARSPARSTLPSPFFARVTPIAKELGYSEDWKVIEAAARPTPASARLDSLGPFRWQPSPAPTWTLKDCDRRGTFAGRLSTASRSSCSSSSATAACTAPSRCKPSARGQGVRSRRHQIVAISSDDPRA